MKKIRNGFSTLEFAAVLPIILGFVLGVLAVSRVFQAHSVLQEGVRTTLRCLKSTDDCAGGNFKVKLDEDPFPPTFNWKAYKAPDLYFVKRYSYSAVSSWLMKPTYTYPVVGVDVIADVTATYPQTYKTYKSIAYPVKGEVIAFVMTARSPLITGDNALEPKFRYRRDPDREYKPYEVIRLRGPKDQDPKDWKPDEHEQREDKQLEDIDVFVRRNTDEPVKLHAGPNSSEFKVITFKTPPAPSFHGMFGKLGTKCYELTGDAIDKFIPEDKINFNSDCTDRLSIDGISTVIHVTGRGHGGPGTVTMRLDWPGSKDGLPLGGREYGQGIFGNFVPRGLYDEHYLNEETNKQRTDSSKKYDEFYIYKKIFLPFDTRISLTLKVENGENSKENTQWNGGVVKIFYSEYSLKGIQRYCGRDEDQQDSENKGQRVTKKPSELKEEDAYLRLGKKVYKYPESQCSLLANNQDSMDREFELLSERAWVDPSENVDKTPAVAFDKEAISPEEQQVIEAGKNTVDYILSDPIPTDPLVINHTCPQQLVGVPQKADGSGCITDSAEAETLCPIVPPSTDDSNSILALNYARINQYGKSASPTKCWREEHKELVNQEYVWTKNTCQEEFKKPSFQGIPPEKVQMSEKPTKTTYAPFYDKSQVPDILKQTSEYKCDAFKVEKVDFNRNSNSDVPETSLFAGYHIDLGEKCMESRLTDEAISLNLADPAAYFKINEPVEYDEIAISTEPTSKCGVKYRVSKDLTKAEPYPIANSGPLPRGVRPPECDLPDVTCKAEYASLGGDISNYSNYSQKLQTQKMERALQLGREAIRVGLPGVPICDKEITSDCVQLKTRSFERNKQLVFAADASVTVGIFGYALTEVKIHSEQLAEINFVR